MESFESVKPRRRVPLNTAIVAIAIAILLTLMVFLEADIRALAGQAAR